MRWSMVLAGAVLAAAAVAATGAKGAGSRKGEEAKGVAVDPGLTAEEIWTQKCKGCHGADGKADTAMAKKVKMRDLSAAGWQAKNSDYQVRAVIRDGRSHVPRTRRRPAHDLETSAARPQPGRGDRARARH